MAFSLALSSMSAVPAFAFADNGNGKGKAFGKNNHGQEVKAEVHSEHENEGKVNFGLGIGKFLSIDGLSTVSSSNLQLFKQQMKDAKNTKKTADKSARITLKTDIKAATTQDQKSSAIKTYLNSILSSFQAFAAAKTAALTALINSIGNNTTNQAPTANAQSVSLSKNTSKSITLTGSDPESQSLTFTVLTNPTHGTLSGTVPNLSYLPDTDYTGSDSFTFKVNDGSLDSASATVSITVNP